MKEKFLILYGKDAPEILYMYGASDKVAVITKRDEFEYYSLYVFDPMENFRPFLLKSGTYDELMDIINLITYSFDTLYYVRGNLINET